MQDKEDIQDRWEQSSVKQKLPINIFCHHKRGGDYEEDVHYLS